MKLKAIPKSSSTSIFRLLVVHQSAELYGSDRSLLDFLTDLDRSRFDVLVCLPENGPLVDLLVEKDYEVHVISLFKVARSRLSFKGIFNMPGDMKNVLRGIDEVVAGRYIDVVYSNTLAVLAGAFWARSRTVPHVWHVREIIKKPALVSFFFRWLAPALSSRIICNSGETYNWVISGHKSSADKTTVVWNGVDATTTQTSQEFSVKKVLREQLGLPELPMVLMIGRVNSWKGQDLLVEAAEKILSELGPIFQIVMVGGPPPGQPSYMTQLKTQVAKSPAARHLTVREFTQDTATYYAAADLLVVPSREPEPFGRVAIEGMAHGLPVIASNHGGLVEIVDHGITGLLVPPNHAGALADAVIKILVSSTLRDRCSKAGRERQRALFSLTAYRQGVIAVVDGMLAHANTESQTHA